jgi:hypothetical protein
MPSKHAGLSVVAHAKARRFVGKSKPDDSLNTPPAWQVQILAGHLHRLGPRAIHELILELVARFVPEVQERVEVYARLDPAQLRALRGDHFPPRLVAMNGGGR